MSISTATRTPSLPTEMLDQIFGYVVDSAGSSSVAHESLKNFSLVCRSWRGPAQRLLFAEIDVQDLRQFTNFESCLARRGEMGNAVKTFKLTGTDYPGWICKALPGLLRPLTNLLSLTLTLTSPTSHYYADFPKLDTLRELRIVYEHLHKKLTPFPHIIALAPNITSLSLAILTSGDPTWTRQSNASEPIALPSLRALSLGGLFLCTSFEKTRLLTDETLRQVKTISLDGLGQFDQGSSRTACLSGKICLQLHTLHFHGYLGKASGPDYIMSECSCLATLIIHGLGLPNYLPPSLEVLCLQEADWKRDWMSSNCLEIVLLGCFNEGLFDKNRRLRLELPRAPIRRRVWKCCKEQGIDIFAQGVLYKANRVA